VIAVGVPANRGQGGDRGCLPSAWVHPGPWGGHQLHPRSLQGVWVDPDIRWLPSRPLDTYQIYDGTDENGIFGKVAPGLFAQEGRCWRMIYQNPVGQPGHCMQPVAWVGRWNFLKGWTKVWSCERHADERRGPGALPHKRNLPHGGARRASVGFARLRGWRSPSADVASTWRTHSTPDSQRCPNGSCVSPLVH
jgi:hypothetical protein